MENIRWRNGLSGANSAERLLLLEAEHLAKQTAIKEWYNERLAETGALVVDAHDLDVRGASTRWGRKEGRLYLVILVYGRSAGRLRTFTWRSALRAPAEYKRVKQAPGQLRLT